MCPKDVAYFCSNWLFLFGGFDRAQMNITLLEEVVKVWDTELCSYRDGLKYASQVLCI